MSLFPRSAWYALILPVSLAACSSGTEGVSLEEASQLVLEEIIQVETLDHNLIAFRYPEPLVSGDVLEPYNFHGGDPAPGRTEIDAGAWFFWIDDAPGAHFAHPNRFVLVDQITGDLTVTEQQWWPELNGEALWSDEASYFDEGNWLYSTISFEEPEPTGWDQDHGSMALASFRPTVVQTERPGHAIVINAHSPEKPLGEDFADDGRLMVDVLKQVGFDTTYLGPKDDQIPERAGDVFGETSSAGLRVWAKELREQSSKLKAGETLVVYLAGHGAVDDQGGMLGVGGNIGIIRAEALARELERFDPGVHIVVVVQSCFSGAFVSPLEEVADLTMTSSAADEPSYGDVDFYFGPMGFANVAMALTNDFNLLDDGSEFTSSLVSGWKSLLDDPEKMERIREEAERRGLGFWTLFPAEAFREAESYDVTARLGITTPQISFGGKQVEDDVSLQTEPVTVTPVVVQQSCTPNFDENNEIVSRTPGFQGLFEFSGPEPDELFGGTASFVFEPPEGEALEFTVPIVPDTSSGEPIASLSYANPEIPPGVYPWQVVTVIGPDGQIRNTVPALEGEFEVSQKNIEGCLDYP